MRILAYLHDYPPQARVGSWLTTHRFLVALVDRGHHVDALIGARRAPYVLDGVRVQHEGHMMVPLGHRADVFVSIQGDDAKGHKAARAFHKPSVRFVHGFVDNLTEKLVRYGEPALVVFNSQSLSTAVGYSGSSMIAYPPFNIDEFTLDHPGDHITLVNLTEDKGVRTFDQLARYLPRHRFLGVRGGYGNQVELWRKNITVVPSTRKMPGDVYARTRILLMPSRSETWGLAAIEAMSCGIPVIAHPTPGLKESIGEAGYYADRDDLDAWIDIIERLDKPKIYGAASIRARQRAEKLACDDSVTRFVKALESLL